MLKVTYTHPTEGQVVVEGIRIIDIPPGNNRGAEPAIRINTAVSGGGTSVGAGGGIIPISWIDTIEAEV